MSFEQLPLSTWTQLWGRCLLRTGFSPCSSSLTERHLARQCDTADSGWRRVLLQATAFRGTAKPLGLEMEGRIQFPSRMRKCPIFFPSVKLLKLLWPLAKAVFPVNFHQDQLALIY